MEYAASDDQLSADSSAVDGDAAPAGLTQSDETGIEPVLAGPVCRPRRRSLVRIGRLAVPVGASAWALSILVHGALVAAACLLVRYYGLAIGGQPGGDSPGGSDVSLVSGHSPGPIIQPGLPASELAPDNSQPQLHKIESEEVPADPSFDNHATRTALSDASDAAEREDFLVIGARGGSFMSAPAFHHAGGAGAALSNHAKRPAGAASSGSGGGGGAVGEGVSTYPGLPGELAGKGFPKPNYPLEARRRGQEGTVIVELEIRSDGSVGRIRALKDPGFPMLRETALAAAEKLRVHRFIPATRNGKPVNYPAVIRYEFSLR